MTEAIVTVEVRNEILVVDSRLVAENLGIRHKSFVETIENYETQIEQAFGVIRFETENTTFGRGRPQRFAWLTEEQATFLMTLSRNTEQVVNCKANLVKAFVEARNALKPSPSTPQTYIEALKALVAAEEQKLLLQAEKDELEKENEQLAEAVDELFSYSSIIRVAKFNDMDEKAFTWRKLKAATKVLGLEVKRVPCPRFGTKLLYPHDAWRFCYPEVMLPETTTLVIGKR